MKNKKIAFGWYGGKFSHLSWLLPLLPSSTHYCEPFGGSAAVILNRDTSPVETYNDIDSDLVNFFRVLRQEDKELIRQIALTPYSREEYLFSIKAMGNHQLDPIERARLFFVRARQSRLALAQVPTPNRWAYCKTDSKKNKSGAVSRWLGSVDGLTEIVERLQYLQIENDSASNVIDRYDSEETLFYCDPPYPHQSRTDKRGYGFEMSDQDHIDLRDKLCSIKGKAAISGYECNFMNDLYKGWTMVKGEPKNSGNTKSSRTECLWVNYTLESDFQQLDLGII